MRKILSILLIIIMIFCITGCKKPTVQFSPAANWAEEYKNSPMLNEAELREFKLDFRIGYTGRGALHEYLIEHELEVENFGDEVVFIEGVKLSDGSYVVITENISINFSYVAIRFEKNNEKINVLEVTTAGKTN